MKLVCYPTAGKNKAQLICEKFARGCGGLVAAPGELTLHSGPAFFYGWWPHHTALLIEKCIREGHDWYYADNAYGFGYGEEIRITRGAVMHDGSVGSGTRRGWSKLERYGVSFRKWQKSGRHIVIACQTDAFYRDRLGKSRAEWVGETIAAMEMTRGREVRVVEKPPRPADPGSNARLMAELQGAWALVTYSSMAGVHAICEGVPVFSAARAFSEMGLPLSMLHSIESPSYPDMRERWLSTLLGNQWTLDEIEKGIAWRDLQEP